MPAEAGINWTDPEGGLFLWLTLPPYIDAAEMFPEAAKNGGTYVIGSPFRCDGARKNTMRLNFSSPSEKEIEEAVKRLAGSVKKHLIRK